MPGSSIARATLRRSQPRIAVCRKALALDATLVETEKALASMALACRQVRIGAEGLCRADRAQSRRTPTLTSGSATRWQGMGKGAEAEASYRQAVAVEPAYWGAYSALATYLFQRGKIDEATVALRKVTELVPSSAYAWSNLGGGAADEGRFRARPWRRTTTRCSSSRRRMPIRTWRRRITTLAGFPRRSHDYERAAALGEHDYVIQGNLADASGRSKAAATRPSRDLPQGDPAGRVGTRGHARQADLARRSWATYYGRVGEPEPLAALPVGSAAARPGNALRAVFLGVAAADRGDRETALQAVAELVRMGYPPALLRSAPEFRSLLQDAEYKQIVGAG